MELVIIALRGPASFRNQADLISKCARAKGWGVQDQSLQEAVVGPPKDRSDMLIAVMPLWPRYIFDVVRFTAWSTRDHVIYGPVDGPYQMNINLFQVMRNMTFAAPSQWCAEQIRTSAGVPCGVTPHGIDHADFKFTPERIAAQRQVWAPKNPDRTILFSNVNPIHRKGFPHLCKALKILHGKLGDKFLMVLHTGKARARSLYPDILKTPGLLIEDTYNTLPFRAIALKTAAADALVSPSLNEGFGLTILEGMAAQRIIVCLDAPAMNELVDDKTAWMFPMTKLKTERWKNGAIAHLHEYNPASLASAMEKAITHKAESKKRAEAAYKKSLEYDYMKVYKPLLAR